MKIFPVMVDDAPWFVTMVASMIVGGCMNKKLIERYAIVISGLFILSLIAEAIITVVTSSEWDWSIVFLFWIGTVILLAFLVRGVGE